MLKIFAFLMWWIQRVFEKLESIASNLSKELIVRIDSYRLPIYSNPFIEADIKPPTA